jgi:MinD-like ATPase involved in chromosome partitioning or flagellar assembly
MAARDWSASPGQDPWASSPEAVPAGDAATDAPPVPIPAVPAVPFGPEAFATKVPEAAAERPSRRRGLRRRIEGGRHGSPALSAEAEAWARAALTQPVPACRRIAVVSVRGGAGKTTLAALVGTALATHRQDRVLTVDADPAMGSLPLRLGVAAARSLRDLATARPESWEDSSAFLARAGERLWLLPGSQGGRHGAELEFEVFQAAVDGLESHFAASVIDCGAGLLGGLQQGVLATAHAQILVTPCTVSGAVSALGALDWLVANGHEQLVPRTVIALVTHTPDAEGELGRIRERLSAGGMTVMHLPYDSHLARGTSIEPGRAGAATRAAAFLLAADVFTRAVRAEYRREPGLFHPGA